MGISQSSECKLQAMKLSNQRSWYFDDVIAPVNVSYECLESSKMYSSSSYQQASSVGQGSPLWTSSYPIWKQCIQRWPALTRSSFHLVGEPTITLPIRGLFSTPTTIFSLCCMVRLFPLQLVPKRQDRPTTRSRWQERDGFGWHKTGLANLGKALSSSGCLLI